MAGMDPAMTQSSVRVCPRGCRPSERMIRPRRDALEIRGMRRRTLGPAREETAQEGLAVVGEGDCVDMDALTHDAVERPMWRRRGRDPRDEADAAAGEIGHAGRAVVDDGQAAVRKLKVAQNRSEERRVGKEWRLGVDG